MDEQVTSFFFGAPEVNNGFFGIDIEVEIDFPSSGMRMARPCIPDRAILEVGKSPRELAGLHILWNNETVDGPDIALFLFSAMTVICFLKRNINRWISGVCRCRSKIELSWCFLIKGAEGNDFGSSRDIKSIEMMERIFFSIEGYNTFSTDIDDSHFPTIKEMLGTKFWSRRKSNFLFPRNDTADNDSIDVRISPVDVIYAKDILNQIFLAKTFRIIMLIVFPGRIVTSNKFHNFFLSLSDLSYK